MIDAKELRIGNWVLINGRFIYMDAKIFHVVILGFEGYEPEPISLTPEILEKCGFDIDLDNFNWNAYKEFENNGLSHYVSLRFNKTKQFWFFRHAASPIKHIHQLQNLYFALTGKELDVKL